MADRVGVIDKGRLLLVEEKHALMARMGSIEADFTLAEPLAAIPPSLASFNLVRDDSGRRLTFRGEGGTDEGRSAVAALARSLTEQGIHFTAIDQHQSSLEDIFVRLVEKG